MTIPLTSKRLLSFTPPSLRATEDSPQGYTAPTFDLRVPSYQDKDEIGLRLYRLGLRQVSTDTIRALMVSEIYAIEKAETPEAAEAAAEEKAIWIEQHWSLTEQDNADEEAWNTQERERLADIAAGAPEREPAPKPVKRTSVRDRARVALMVQDIIDGSQRVRDKLADQQSYDVRYRQAMVRLHLAHIHGLKTKVSLSGGLVDDSVIEALRGELFERGDYAAYDELVQEISDLYELPKEEVGNSGSPRENISPASGSPQPSAESAPSDGSSTSGSEGRPSSIEPAPAAASPPITETSSQPSPAAESNMDQSAGLTTAA
jgi:hypothetical protein